jgi:signal transduction histidine kinase
VVGRTHHLRTSLQADTLPPLGPATEQELFRIAQEALSNVVRHAAAHEVQVGLCEEGSTIVLTVADDGRGFDPGHRSVSSRRLGLVSMRERAVDLGGALAIESAPGQGTTVRAEVPAT